MKKIEKIKRMAAGALAIAIIALGTSCGKTTETTDSTAPIVSTGENKLKLEDIKDVKPVYADNILKKEEINASIKLNDVIKRMVNEDNLYGENFDFLTERLTITGIYLESLNNVQPDYAEINYAPSNLTKVNISYDADVVDKETAQKNRFQMLLVMWLMI